MLIHGRGYRMVEDLRLHVLLTLMIETRHFITTRWFRRVSIGTVLLLAAISGACSAQNRGVASEPPVKWIGDGIDRQAIREDIVRAQQALRSFASTNHLESGLEALRIGHIEIFSSKTMFDQRLIAIDGLPPDTKFPLSYVAVVDGNVLYACSEQAAITSNPAVKSRTDYVELLTHEMAHALHIALLDGDEARMGPRWFYEGFAVVAAGQFVDQPPISKQEYLDVVFPRTKPDYRLYGAALRKLAQIYPLAELISRASKPGFCDWATSAVSFP
jgi:hypothetical protein